MKEPKKQPEIVMPDKLKEAINKRREESAKRLAIAQQRENAAFEEATMSLIEGWLCSQDVSGKININMADLSITVDPTE